ncbi:MAG: glycosyltransferase family 4 protein [Patescibacteria group bacterium]
MRVCFYTGTADIRGGSTRYVTDISEELRKQGHMVDILVRKGKFLMDVMRLRRYARTHDIIHAIDLNPRGFDAYFATRFTPAKLVITVQGSYGVAPLDNRKTALLARIVYRAAAAVVAISSYIKREIDWRMRGANVVVITHGVDLTRFHSTATHKSDAPYVLGVGSIKRRKGYDTALRAFIRAKKEIPDLRYVIVGAQIDEPNYVQKLMQTVRESGVEDSVDFVKDISDERLRELYQGASLFMLTSVNEGGHFEGFGLVFLEAAAYGLASIGTKGNGIEDAIIDGKTGILVPQYDVEATAAAIVRLMRDTELRTRLGAAARAHAEARAWPHVVREYEQLYKRVLS